MGPATAATRRSTAESLAIAVKLLGTLLSLVVFAACAAPSEPSTVPDHATLERYGEEIGFQPISEDTTTVEPLRLEVLPARAVVARWLGRAPVPELVLVQSDDGRWRATLGNVTWMEGWKKAMRPALRLAPQELDELEGKPDSADRLAADLARLVVDPDPSFGGVVASEEQIPLDHGLSDVRKDMEIEDLSPAEIERELRSRLPASIEPPRMERLSPDNLLLTFATWKLYGGSVLRWRVTLGSSPSIEPELIAKHMGSYRRYYY